MRLKRSSGGGSPGPKSTPAASTRDTARRADSSTDRTPASSIHSHSAYVAKPSLSQMSDQSATETELPTHWWAISWAMTKSWTAFGANVERVWVSMAPQNARSTTAAPAVGKG
jgi:hypothetical protein